MSPKVFNSAMLFGWLLILIGGCLINLGGGLFVAGALLMLCTYRIARVAGVHAGGKEEERS